MVSASSYKAFEIENHISIVEGKGSLPLIHIENDYAKASISIYGAQVLSYVPKKSGAVNNQENDDDLLFVSESAYFEHGKAIKGGIPICWPWFGRDANNPEKQMHGFARNMLWTLEETASTGSNTTIKLSLRESDETYKLWPHSFELVVTVNIGKTLQLSLTTMNTGVDTFKMTQALHAYLSVADIEQVEVEGLDGVQYLDKVTFAKYPELQKGKVKIDQEVDRIYINVPSETTLKDLKAAKETLIKSKGSETTIVWNPWIEISKNSADLSDAAYQQFVCIETANAAEDFIEIEPAESYTIEAEYLTM